MTSTNTTDPAVQLCGQEHSPSRRREGRKANSCQATSVSTVFFEVRHPRLHLRLLFHVLVSTHTILIEGHRQRNHISMDPCSTGSQFTKWTSEPKKKYVLSDLDLERTCPLDNSRIYAAPKHDLGQLDLLPLEILQATLVQVDLRTLTGLRRVNRRARQVISSIPDYRNIVNHSPTTLRACLSIETAKFTTPEGLWNILTTATCSCGRLGSYISLLTFQRLCFRCVLSQGARPISPAGAVRTCGITRAVADSLPCMHSLPGHYSEKERRYRKRERLVDTTVAWQAGITKHGSEQAMKSYVLHKTAQAHARYLRQWEEAQADKKHKRVRRPKPLLPDPWGTGPSEVKRFMAIVEAPWINKADMSVHWGRVCLGCQVIWKDERNEEIDPLRVHNVGSFEQHLKKAGPIVENREGGLRHVKPKAVAEDGG